MKNLKRSLFFVACLVFAFGVMACSDPEISPDVDGAAELSIQMSFPYQQGTAVTVQKLADNAYLKIKGPNNGITNQTITWGGKWVHQYIDATSGASAVRHEDAAITTKGTGPINSYARGNLTGATGNKYFMIRPLRDLLLFGLTKIGTNANTDSYNLVRFNMTGESADGEGIKKEGGKITVIWRYGTTTTGLTWRKAESDVNGVFTVPDSFKSGTNVAGPWVKDTDITAADQWAVDADATQKMWKGTLQGRYENNVFTLEGKLTLQ